MLVHKLETERLLLRPITFDDSDRIEELAGEYDVAKSTLNIPHPYPKGSASQFIESTQTAEQNNKIVMFAIINKETKLLIGLINLNLSISYQRGELAYWIGKEYWGNGYGTEAAKALLEYGFNQLKLNKIFAASFTSNTGSWKVMEKIGLKYEGTLKQHVSRFGQFYDLTYYGLLKDEFENIAQL
ncbi:Putative ribosomal N-acetyltransferase YdaF [Solibacillus isronensis B3W22]|uniref:Putative ribosomal N-acetyltransferase YdaF n=1 Tax=Solibacillus isronensis B3W22 TaxID=1224748 RepID=K1KVB1_9BACL|nr:GNAT family protein [Solibacillus isronensis]AMO85818.1 acetyltransferase [Solibacillus silvestris]EKB46476.1 Putative ribosomal N-acetyltransferase YdaF [Solibacillus isronensis B3W22]